MTRSAIHMLTVAAARLESDGVNPKLVADMRALIKREVERVNDGRTWSPSEDKRVGRQRTLMAMVPDTRAKDQLMEEMLQRAYDLMWEGRGLECDAIAEFLPSKDVERMFDAWQSDQSSKEAKSKFYEART